MPEVFTADDARAWAVLTRAVLAARRLELDALNVYPVPDGDTGTNLYLTWDVALGQVVEEQTRAGTRGKASLAEEAHSLAQAILLSARGNSGVIVSQLVRGLSEGVRAQGGESLNAAGVVDCFERGALLARRSVAHPQEGTILSVADAAAAAAARALTNLVPPAGEVSVPSEQNWEEVPGSLEAVVSAASLAAHEALLVTPEQLPALAQAGVVDAGGAGLVLLLEALHRVVSGNWGLSDLQTGPHPDREHRLEWRPAPTERQQGMPTAGAPHSNPAQTIDDALNPAFEVMFLLADSDDAQVERLKTVLDDLGDSLIVVGGPDVWNVHVHVDDVGAALEAAIAAGRPHRIKVTHFAEQIAARNAQRSAGGAVTAVVACALGPGIAELMTQAGAVTLASAPGARASAGALLEAARATGASAVLMLPNDKDTIAAAEAAAAAAHNDGLPVHVIPARTVVQGLAALAVHDPAADLHTNVVAMTSAVAATRHGAITVAVKEGLTSGGPCQVGDVLGIVNGDIVLVGGELSDVGGQVVTRLLSGGGELLTLVVGRGGEEAAASIRRLARRTHPEVEVSMIDGGQDFYPLLMGVE